MITSDVITYYSNLLILQYGSFGNAIGTVQAYVGELIQNQIVSQIQTAFILQSAIGNQLNVLGSYRGAYRQLFGIALGSFWGMIPYSDPLPNSYFGWATYSGSAPTDIWLQYSDSSTISLASSLSDTQFRKYINFLVAIHSSPLTLATIDNILYATFGSYVNLIDNGNMTIIYQHQGSDPDPDGLWGILELAGALPNPCGVGVIVENI